MMQKAATGALRIQVFQTAIKTLMSTEYKTPEMKLWLHFHTIKKPVLEIRDLDSESQKPLDGGSFEVYHQGKLIRSGLLQGKKLTFSNMDPGIYTVKQIKASEGYETDQTETQVNLELNKVISVSFFSHHSHD